MQIANPIYDVVFKYLMDDAKIAKLMISSIIKEELEELEFMPQERVVALENRPLTVFRLDFKAKIKTSEGCKTVLIEIQKAKFATDIMRFRKYLGDNYIDKENSIVKENGARSAFPLICIYFLGHKLEIVSNAIIKVERHYTDVITGEKIEGKEEFIESLTHDSYIIQIPQLHGKRKSELEILLSVFDQANATRDTHILQVNEEDFPEEYRHIIRRLQTAIAEPKVRDTMNVEDEILEELENKERYIEKIEKELETKEKVIEDKDKVIENSKIEIKVKDSVIENKDKEIENKDKEIESKDKLIAEMLERITKLESR